MVQTLGIVGGAILTFAVVVLHFSKGTEWTPREDISQDVLEQRAAVDELVDHSSRTSSTQIG